MRRLVLRAALVLAALLAVPGAADAYVIGGAAWPGRPARITYYVAAPDAYRFSIAWGARAWNESGARVRFVEVRSRRQAAVVIREDRTMGYSGFASIGFQPDSYVKLRGCERRSCPARFFVAAIAAHELGHVLGLDHPPRGCALMRGDSIYAGCPPADPPVEWQWQCRLLMRDDIAGAVRLYGGTVRVRRQRWCAKGPAPRAVRGARVTALSASPLRVARLDWRTPAATQRVRVLRRAGSCPAVMSRRGTEYLDNVAVRPGRAASFVDDLRYADGLLPAGTYCYRLVPVSADERPGKPVDLRLDYPGPPPVPAPSALAVVDATTVAGGYDTRIDVTAPAVGWLASVEVRRRAGTCPTAIDDPASEWAGRESLDAGKAVVHDLNPRAAGTWCYAAFVVDDWGRVGAARTATLVFMPPHVADVTGLAAAYRVESAAVRLTWAWPADADVVTAEVDARAGACPTTPPEHDAQPPEAAQTWVDRAATETDLVGLAPGTWCITVYTNGTSGFWGRGASVAVEVPAPV